MLENPSTNQYSTLLLPSTQFQRERATMSDSFLPDFLGFSWDFVEAISHPPKNANGRSGIPSTLVYQPSVSPNLGRVDRGIAKQSATVRAMAMTFRDGSPFPFQTQRTY